MRTSAFGPVDPCGFCCSSPCDVPMTDSCRGSPLQRERLLRTASRVLRDDPGETGHWWNVDELVKTLVEFLDCGSALHPED